MGNISKEKFKKLRRDQYIKAQLERIANDPCCKKTECIKEPDRYEKKKFGSYRTEGFGPFCTCQHKEFDNDKNSLKRKSEEENSEAYTYDPGRGVSRKELHEALKMPELSFEGIKFGLNRDGSLRYTIDDDTDPAVKRVLLRLIDPSSDDGQVADAAKKLFNNPEYVSFLKRNGDTLKYRADAALVKVLSAITAARLTFYCLSKTSLSISLEGDTYPRTQITKDIVAEDTQKIENERTTCREYATWYENVLGESRKAKYLYEISKSYNFNSDKGLKQRKTVSAQTLNQLQNISKTNTNRNSFKALTSAILAELEDRDVVDYNTRSQLSKKEVSRYFKNFKKLGLSYKDVANKLREDCDKN